MFRQPSRALGHCQLNLDMLEAPLFEFISECILELPGKRNPGDRLALGCYALGSCVIQALPACGLIAVMLRFGFGNLLVNLGVPSSFESAIPV